MKKDSRITVEELEAISQRENIPFINLLSGYGAEYVLSQIADTDLKKKLWLKTQNMSGMETYRAGRIEGLVFFPAEDNRKNLEEAVKALFDREGDVRLCRETDRNLPFSMEIKNRILLEICLGRYCLPFFVQIDPYKEVTVHPGEHKLEGMFLGKNPLSYYRFPMEEYLAQGFYQILDKLELLNDLFWYKEIYDTISGEPVEGRKVWDSFGKMLNVRRIPSLEKRLGTIRGYRDYGYMKKKWKKESKRRQEEFPKWEDVVESLTAFFTPIFDAVIKDEIFFGDWMPGIQRYL